MRAAARAAPFIAGLVAGLVAGLAAAAPAAAQEGPKNGAPVPFTLSLLGAKTGGTLPMAQVRDSGGCKGGDAPPRLAWAAAPKAAKGFALTMFDLTANFWHWALYDLPADARTFEPGRPPSGTRTGRNDFGAPGFGGACPPPGKPHRYRVTVWALPEATLPLAAGASDKEVGAYLAAHASAHADLVFSYGR